MLTVPDELAALRAWLHARAESGPLVERVLWTSSRTWTRASLLREALLLLPPTAVLVHGMATGGDTLADQVWGGWLNRRVEQHPLPEGWWKVGRWLPLQRDDHMVALGADLCLACIRARSRGASYTADHAEAAGITTFRFRQEA